MRVSLLTDTYLPEINGVTTVLATMRNGLVERGFDVQIIAPRYEPPGPDDWAVIRRPSVPFPGYSAARLSSPFGADVFKALRRARPDLIHVVTEGPIGLLGRRFALRRGSPLVTSFHTDFPRYAARYVGKWAERPTRAYLRWFHGRARHVQTPSEATRSELVQFGMSRPLCGAGAWIRESSLPSNVRRNGEPG